MRLHRLSFGFLLLACLSFLPTPGFAVSKEIVQLQTQVQQLQDQMARMQQSFDERMGVMRNLVEQQTDTVNKINGNFQGLRQALAKGHDEQAAHDDQLSGQIQALNDSVDELKARLAKVSTQLDQMTAGGQNITNQPPVQPAQPAPPADQLYNGALRDYNANKLDLAAQEFSDYLRYYPNTELAGNAQFYVADIEYRQGNYTGAVKDYDKVLQQYPGGNKAPAAHLKKGMALIQLGQRDAGVNELNNLIQRYPRSIEAATARDQLRKLGTAPRGEAVRKRGAM